MDIPPACLPPILCELAVCRITDVAAPLPSLPPRQRLLVADHSLHVEGMLHLHLGALWVSTVPTGRVGILLCAGGDKLNQRIGTLIEISEPIVVGGAAAGG